MSKADKKTPRKVKDKYEHSRITKGILQRECNAFGDLNGTVLFMSMDLDNKEDRECLKEQIVQIKDIFDKALKELGWEE